MLLKDVEIIDEELYFIKQYTRPGWFVGVTLALGVGKIGLIDTGFDNTPEERIFPTIVDLGRRPEEINYVVNTHRDGDHIQGNKIIKDRTKAVIAAHELEVGAITTADIKLKEGDAVVLGDRKFTILHTPGHQPGNICLYDQSNNILISGDTICGDRTDLIRMDEDIYTKSLMRLLNLDIKILVMSHPFNPVGKNILTGKESKDMIRASIGIAEEL